MTDRASAGVAVVTGAGSGLGRSIAQKLLAARWRVALAGRRDRQLHETVTAAVAAPPESALVVPTDVSVPDSVAALFETVRQHWGRVDLLVNNAGVFGPAGAADEVTPAGWQAAVDINLTGSISAHSPRPRSICYTATKHAITGLTKSLSLDGRNFDIACGQIDIGNAATDMTQIIGRGVPQADGSVAPEPTFDAQHVADAVLYMAALPLDANVQFMTIAATKMPFIGRG